MSQLFQSFIFKKKASTIFSKVNPATNLLLYLFLAISALLSFNIPLLLSITAIAAVLVIASRAPFKFIRLFLIIAFWFGFVLGAGIFFFGLYSGKIIYQATVFGILFRITSGNFLNGISLFIKLISLGILTAFYIYITDPRSIVSSMESIKVPYKMSLSLAMVFRNLAIFAGDFEIINQAQKSRGLDINQGGIFERIKKYISIVIPTLNEEENIHKVIKGVQEVLSDRTHEIIVVDGYSKDKTVKIAKSMGATILYDNIGKGSALIKGLHAANGKILISMDADLSNKPLELLLLVAGIEAGYDICMGSRFLMGGGSDDMPFVRRLGNSFFVFLVNLLYKARYTDLCYGYRSFSSQAIKRLALSEKGFGIETEISIKARKANLKILEVPSYEKKRAAGVGKLRTFSDGYIILKTIFKNLRF